MGVIRSIHSIRKFCPALQKVSGRPFLIANYTDVTDREQEQIIGNAGDTPPTTGTNEDSEDSKQKVTKETKILLAETGEPSLPSFAGESLRSFLLLETKQETASQSSALQFLS